MRGKAKPPEESTPGGDRAQERDFESALARLEEIVRTLESGELPLEETVKVFEEGQALVRTCGELLNRAELRVQELLRRGEGGAELRPRPVVLGADGNVDLGEAATPGEDAP